MMMLTVMLITLAITMMMMMMMMTMMIVAIMGMLNDCGDGDECDGVRIRLLIWVMTAMAAAM